MPQPFSTARLEARISTDLHSMLKRAAELQGRTMTDFVVAAVQDAAQRAIEQVEIILEVFCSGGQAHGHPAAEAVRDDAWQLHQPVRCFCI